MKVYPSFLFHVSSIFIHPPMLSPPSMFHPFLSVCIAAERNLPSAPHQKHSIFVARSLLPSTQKKFHWSRRLVVTNRIFFPLVTAKFLFGAMMVHRGVCKKNSKSFCFSNQKGILLRKINN
jgi:hypothetical protein